MTDQLLVGLDDASQRLAVSRRLLQGLIYSGRLPSVSVGRRRLVAVADLERFVDELRAQNPNTGSGGTERQPARLAVVRSRDVATKEKARRRVDAEPQEAASGDPRQPSRV